MRLGAPVLAGVAAAAGWAAGVAAYGFGLLSADPPPPGAGSTALILLIAAAAPAASLAALVAALRARAEPPDGALQTSRVGSAKELEQVAEAAAKRTAKALAGRIAALEAALAETRAGVAALTEAAGVATDMPPAQRETAPARPARAADQPALPFAEPADAGSPIAWADILRALDFPRDEADAEGFAAVRAALRDPQMARLLQAAEDVLGILAAAGLHMEDLSPGIADLAAWRRYAAGERGAAVSAVGGVQDDAALERSRELMRRDAVFRDAALVFVRRYNAFLTRIFEELGDVPLAISAADTRSGRAFMLLARATGAFK